MTRRRSGSCFPVCLACTGSPPPIAAFAYFFYYFIAVLNFALIVGVPDGFTRGGFFEFSFKRMVNAKQKCKKK